MVQCGRTCSVVLLCTPFTWLLFVLAWSIAALFGVVRNSPTSLNLTVFKIARNASSTTLLLHPNCMISFIAAASVEVLGYTV